MKIGTIMRIVSAAAMLLFSPINASAQVDNPSLEYPSVAADAWYRNGKVKSIYADRRGLIRVGLDPDPSTQNFNCGSDWPIIRAYSSITDVETRQSIQSRIHQVLSDAINKNARVSVYLIEETSPSSGAPYCIVDRAQVWAVQDAPRTTTPTSSTPTTTAPRNFYGALAVDNRNGPTVITNSDTQEQADAAALNACRISGGSGCRVTARFGRGVCLAFARDSITNYAYYASSASSLSDAQTKALQGCRGSRSTHSCAVVAWGCNSG